MVGSCLEHGIGVTADPTSAISWYEKAAKQDNPRIFSYFSYVLTLNRIDKSVGILL